MRVSFRSMVAAAALVLGLGSTAQAAGTWNAFALDYEGGYGYGLGLDSEQEAKDAALKECAKRTCEVVFSAESECIAVADNRDDGYWYGYAWGKTLTGTETIALGYCLENDKGECAPLGSACISDRPVASDDGGKNKL
jgi:hypothetical protein